MVLTNRILQMTAQLLNLRDYKAIFFTMLLPNTFIIAMPFLIFTETYSRCLDIRLKRTAPATSAHSEKKRVSALR